LDAAQILYFDTDSVIWARTRGVAPPPVDFGNCLGDVTDEIADEFGPDRYIKKFVSIGPKAYCFQLDDGREVFKAKGVPKLCRPTDGYELFKSMVLTEKTAVCAPYSYEIGFHLTRNKSTGSMRASTLGKRLNKTYDKRVVRRDFSTRAFGAKRQLRGEAENGNSITRRRGLSVADAVPNRNCWPV
jgi:hypothetical protein